MSKTWYPVIDYLTCTECSVCIDKCPYGVIEDSCSCGSYELPDNLRDFFDGKKNKKCDCGGDCC